MALVDEGDEILRKIIQQAERSHALAASVEIPRIVLDAGAVVHFLNHFEVIFHPLLQPLCLQHAALPFEICQPGAEVVLYMADSLLLPFVRGHEIARRVYGHLVQFVDHGTRSRVYDVQGLHFVAEELYAYGVLSVANAYVNCVASDAEAAALEIGLRAVVEGVHQLVQQTHLAARLAFFHIYRLGVEVFGVAYTAEAGDAGYDYHVAAAGQQGGSGAQTQFLYFVVDAQVFFDICIGAGNICLRLIVVVVGDEIFDRVVGKEGLELAVELCGEGLVVTQYERRPLQLLYDVGHSESLSRTGHSQQGYGVTAAIDGLAQSAYGGRLVSGGAVWG